MATLDYHKIWKWIEINWSTFYTFYGKDFNPNVPTIQGWTTIWVSQETSNFNLTWFQPWHEVWCLVLVLNHWWTTWTRYIEAEFQSYVWGWQTKWSSVYNYSVTGWQRYMAYIYFWVDDDEIRDESNQYRIVINREYSDWTWDNWITTNFTVSNLSIDSYLHGSWYLRIEWNYLCYTDWTHGSSWYKHKINYDTWYSWWSWDPWYIRIPSWTTWRIYYTDEYWVVRRTHMADERYWWAMYWYTWYIYVSDWDAEDWYWYLCFVDGNWELRRMGNWTP